MNSKDTVDVGSKLGEFVIERVLGKGGMGVVYKAHEPSLNRKVALKVLSDMLSANEEYIARFRKEAQIVAALNHPNIVSILTFGKDLGRYYFAMEYIKGRDLGQILKEKTVIPLGEALSIARQVAGALSEAGRKGVVHRDLKPSNIMIDALNRVRVTDFGVARLEDSTDGLTKTGMFLGTPEYASPEQATGKPVDTRSDIYALGALLYRMLSGKPPIVGDSPLAVVAKIATEPVTPIGMLNSSIPRSVCELIGKMMAKDLKDRYQTPEKVCAAIDGCEKEMRGERASTALLRPEPEQDGFGGPVSAPASPKSGKKRYWLAGLVAAAAIVLALFWAGGRLFEAGREFFRPTVETPAPTSVPEREFSESPATEPPARTQALSSDGSETTVASTEPAEMPVPVESTGEKVSVATQPLPPDRMEPRDDSRTPLAAVQPQPVKKPEAVALPGTPSVLLLVTGPEGMRMLMRSNLESAFLDSGLRVISPAEIPRLRKKMLMGDTPISWYEVRELVPEGSAHTLVLAAIDRAGTRNLEFYGQTRKQITAVFSIRALNMNTGEAIHRSITGQVKYTAMNITERFEGAVDKATDGLGDAIKADWRSR